MPAWSHAIRAGECPLDLLRHDFQAFARRDVQLGIEAEYLAAEADVRFCRFQAVKRADAATSRAEGFPEGIPPDSDRTDHPHSSQHHTPRSRHRCEFLERKETSKKMTPSRSFWGRSGGQRPKNRRKQVP